MTSTDSTNQQSEPLEPPASALPHRASRWRAAFAGLASLVLVYLIGSRAIDTGSLQQYFLAFVLLFFAANRFFRALGGYK